MNYMPDQQNVTTQIYYRNGTLSEYFANYLQIDKSLVMNTRKEVPLIDPQRFRAGGNNSTIYIPFDMDY